LKSTAFRSGYFRLIFAIMPEETPAVVRRLPPEIRVDLTDRANGGIRISLPPRKGPARLPLKPGYAAPLAGLAAPSSGPPGALRERATRAYAAATSVRPPDDALRKLEYVVVDVETTGGAFSGGHRVTEVAAVRVRGDGRPVAEFATLVNPCRPIPPFITALTRITREMVADAPLFEEIAAPLRAFLADAVFVAHNAPFDWRFLCDELRRAEGRPLRGRVLCTVRLARRVVPEVSRRSLDALQWFFGIENEARHRAWGDARATARIFKRLLDRIDERDITRWSELETLLARKTGRRKRRAMPGPMMER
jgi:DNA polymerase-3 subunit epsilon